MSLTDDIDGTVTDKCVGHCMRATAFNERLGRRRPTTMLNAFLSLILSSDEAMDLLNLRTVECLDCAQLIQLGGEGK